MIASSLQTALLCTLLLLPSSWSLKAPTSGWPSPCAADLRFAKWCDENNVGRINVQTISTPKSLGGRGLFATKAMHNGTIVAFIPAKLVIVADVDQEEWQVTLTNKVMRMKDDATNEWIQSWRGSAPLKITALLRHGATPDFVDGIVDELVGRGRITREGARADLEERWTNYFRRLEHLKFLEDACKWYPLVLSRACYLGKEWGYRVGVVPFFDMLNHCHDPGKCNTELMAFGECRDHCIMEDESSRLQLDNKDFVLVLTRDVDQGEELLTQYESDIENEEIQLKLLNQYGIPPPS